MGPLQARAVTAKRLKLSPLPELEFPAYFFVQSVLAGPLSALVSRDS